MGTIKDIDWDQIWRDSRKRRTCKSKGRKDWDRKAPSFARRNMGSSYIEHLLAAIAPASDDTVLDVGSGPGTLAVPLAGMARQVTAVDFSEVMLEELQKEASQHGVENIITVHASWEDDWQKLGIEPHDITVASRSLAVDDLDAALIKLDKWAVKKVVITDRVGTGPFDPEIFAAVGRTLDAGPDYIITVNMLYKMGINAEVTFIPAEYSETYVSREEAIDSCRWMLDDMSPEEEELFEGHLAGRLSKNIDGTWRLARDHDPKWAVISWQK